MTTAIPPRTNGDIVPNIRHVVVLMMENRSFDHIFGDFPGVNGIQNASSNYLDPADTSSPAYSCYGMDVTSQPGMLWQPSGGKFNPDHGFGGMMKDLFGPAAIGVQNGQAQFDTDPPPVYTPATMCGFVNTNQMFDKDGNACVMSYFKYLPTGDPGRLNVLHTLAENFVVCDNWFCDTPSMTCPNRHFVHIATNMGYNESNPSGPPPTRGQPEKDEGADIYAAKTLYESLDGIRTPNGVTNWAIYGFPRDEYDSAMYAYTSPADTDSPNFIDANRSIFDFSVDVLTGNLPFYTFIMPGLLFGGTWAEGNSMHPPADIRLGENLIASVYNVLRNSPLWNETLLVVVFDENGGIYDHVQPPTVVPPDNIPANNFDYTILGPRVPALLISPWLESGIDSNQYQNTSIPRFAQDLLAAMSGVSPPPYLTARDEQATSVASSAYWRTDPEPRTDCPAFIAPHSGFPNWGLTLTDQSDNMTGHDPDTGPVIAGSEPIPPLPPGDRLDDDSPAMAFAREYCAHLPGHPDSGKTLTRAFLGKHALQAYMRERRRAARTFYAQRGAAPVK